MWIGQFWYIEFLTWLWGLVEWNNVISSVLFSQSQSKLEFLTYLNWPITTQLVLLPHQTLHFKSFDIDCFYVKRSNYVTFFTKYVNTTKRFFREIKWWYFFNIFEKVLRHVKKFSSSRLFLNYSENHSFKQCTQRLS